MALVNVYDKEKSAVVRIDSSELDPKVHMHRNTRTPFSQEDLEGLGYAKKESKPATKESKPEDAK